MSPEEELRSIQACLVHPTERVPGRAYERVQETLGEIKHLQVSLASQRYVILAHEGENDRLRAQIERLRPEPSPGRVQRKRRVWMRA